MKRLVPLRRLIEDAEERGIDSDRILADPDQVHVLDDADDTFPDEQEE